jgi:Ion channel
VLLCLVNTKTGPTLTPFIIALVSKFHH